MYIFKVSCINKEVRQNNDFVARKIDHQNTYMNKRVLGIRDNLVNNEEMDIMLEVEVTSIKRILYCKFNLLTAIS